MNRLARKTELDCVPRLRLWRRLIKRDILDEDTFQDSKDLVFALLRELWC